MNTYTTSEIAAIIGIHPNTVRKYEQLQLISKPGRLSNGYRVFTREHLLQFRLARTAFAVEVLQSGLRKEAVAIVKTTARRDYARAAQLTAVYLSSLRQEQTRGEEAIEIVETILAGQEPGGGDGLLTRHEAAQRLHTTIDTLRNWELNGLFTAKRMQNGYRVYTAQDMQALKIIRTLRLANYSLAAILRMMHRLGGQGGASLRAVIDTPEPNEDVISVCDRLLTSLKIAEQNAQTMLELLSALQAL